MEKIHSPIQEELDKQNDILHNLQSELKLKKIRSGTWQICKSKIYRQKYVIGILEALLPEEFEFAQSAVRFGFDYKVIYKSSDLEDAKSEFVKTLKII